mmetsp:Transcript_39449/g.111800  ORF Transcript_39449/g.111800 Transcript_39449/m.111800 type:complete len:362 (+) Transcript_39449:213-1298(+)
MFTTAGTNGVRAAMSAAAASGGDYVVEHIDITCDGCETEPIVGERFRCSVCRDRDLCSICMRALVTARVLQASQEEPPPPSASCVQEAHQYENQQSARGRGGIHHCTANSQDVAEGVPAWMSPEVQAAVPCLDPAHRFHRMEGPERAVRLLGGPGKGALLPGFLQTFPPSRCSCTDVAWIAVDRDEDAWKIDGPDSSATAPPFEERVEKLLDVWDVMLETHAAVTSEGLDRLAEEHGVTRGKWMLFPKLQEVDRCWEAIAKELVNGHLGPTAKVSSVSPKKDSHVICVTVDNYLDGEQVTRVERTLSEAVGSIADARLLLKPDIYSILGIYAKNQWGMKPTVREANLAGPDPSSGTDSNTN